MWTLSWRSLPKRWITVTVPVRPSWIRAYARCANDLEHWRGVRAGFRPGCEWTQVIVTRPSNPRPTRMTVEGAGT
jgi:hypothetical protein